MNQPNPKLSPAITAQIDAASRAAGRRAAEEQARRAALALVADVEGLRDALQDIAEFGVSTGRAIAAEDQAATVADTLTLFFGAMTAATGFSAAP